MGEPGLGAQLAAILPPPGQMVPPLDLPVLPALGELGAAADVPRFTIWVPGRPAPQGSKHTGQAGQMREASEYLPAWRAAVIKACFQRYLDMGLREDQLPLFRGPLGIRITFSLDPDRRADAAPDGDKLDRAVWDALGHARLWEDDGRVVDWAGSKKQAPTDQGTGAHITVWRIVP